MEAAIPIPLFCFTANQAKPKPNREEFPFFSVGYSHHTKSTYPLELAYAKGAKTIEFHYTHDREKEGFRDHQLSLTSELLVNFNKKLDLIDEVLGSPDKKVTEAELNLNHVEEFRRGVFLKNNVKEGQVITWDDITCLRPEIGVRALDVEHMIGKKATRNIEALERLSNLDYQ